MSSLVIIIIIVVVVCLLVQTLNAPRAAIIPTAVRVEAIQLDSPPFWLFERSAIGTATHGVSYIAVIVVAVVVVCTIRIPISHGGRRSTSAAKGSMMMLGYIHGIDNAFHFVVMVILRIAAIMISR